MRDRYLHHQSLLLTRRSSNSWMMMIDDALILRCGHTCRLMKLVCACVCMRVSVCVSVSVCVGVRVHCGPSACPLPIPFPQRSSRVTRQPFCVPAYPTPLQIIDYCQHSDVSFFHCPLLRSFPHLPPSPRSSAPTCPSPLNQPPPPIPLSFRSPPPPRRNIGRSFPMGRHVCARARAPPCYPAGPSRCAAAT